MTPLETAIHKWAGVLERTGCTIARIELEQAFIEDQRTRAEAAKNIAAGALEAAAQICERVSCNHEANDYLQERADEIRKLKGTLV